MVINRDSGLRLPVLLLILLLPGLILFFTPLVLSTDSMYGFLAYKGTLWNHAPNQIVDVYRDDLNYLTYEFVSWWSPGQWLIPGIIQYPLHSTLGIASIVTTLLFAMAGMLGYHRLFRHFQFSDRIITLSLLTIFFSSNFNYSYIVYQGGEILSFGIFPWFLLYTIKASRATVFNVIILTLFFLACFVAKTTLVIYCGLGLLYKIAEPSLKGFAATRKLVWPVPRYFLYAVPVVISCLLIYYFFLVKGSIPTVVNRLGISVQDILVPLSSPVTALFSVQNAIASAGRSFPSHTMNSQVVMGAIYLVCTVITFWSGRYLLKSRQIDPEFRRMLLFLYAGLCMFFIFSYIMNTNIDYSTRHLKLLAFLCIPVLLMAAMDLVGKKVFYVLFGLAAALNVVYFINLRHKLTTGRYISNQYFFRANDKPDEADHLDEESYKKLRSVVNRYDTLIKARFIVYLESNPDVALDYRSPIITEKTDSLIVSGPFKGKGRVVIACLSKQTLERYPGILRQKFPDCEEFRQIDETEGYRYFISGETDRPEEGKK